jgi:hypothetical protein
MERLVVKGQDGVSSIVATRRCWQFVTRGGQRVSVSACLFDAMSTLICAGWVPQDRVFGASFTAV